MSSLQNKTKAQPTQMAKNVIVQKTEMISIRSLLVFLNNTLDCELRGMDDLKTGAVYCQVMHRLFPTSILIHKVKFYTHTKVDFDANFRLLHNCFEKLKVTRYLPVEELIVGHNHVDFCNWIYKFYKVNDNGQEYDAKKVRKDSPIGLSKSLEIACFATGNLNAMHKCQSMIFNYTKNPYKYERRSSLDSRSIDRLKLKKPESQKQSIKPPPQTKGARKASEFHAESKNVSLPSDSEGELTTGTQQPYPQNQYAEKHNSKRALTGVSFTIESPNNSKNGPDPKEFKSWKALIDKCDQSKNELQSKAATIRDLQCKIRHLDIEQEQLADKLGNVEHILFKYGDNPKYAVQQLKDILLNNPQVVAIRPRRRHECGDSTESNHHCGSTTSKVQLTQKIDCSKHLKMPEMEYSHLMPPCQSKECLSKESKDRDTKSRDWVIPKDEGSDYKYTHRSRSSMKLHCHRHCPSMDSKDSRSLRHHSKGYKKHSLDSMDEDEDHKHRHHSTNCRIPDCRCHFRDCMDIGADHQYRRLSRESDPERKHRHHRRYSGDRDSDHRHSKHSKHTKHSKSKCLCFSKSMKELDFKPNYDSDSTFSTKEESNNSKDLDQNDTSIEKQ
ncbi:uncharacterized protein LOC108038677 [Drosophila rhopaloa]|uniref:Uncharacterized protein LOC108038677 n=1 Tax=Drosophila rhopaloa TaxID=1041015 RepID=A0A6P4DZ68_DRORH|nr:uncharacterized protein LOC108038677 [Drosophila rhopaloa]XP_016970996.1 uncharacterized protein LOC108038677 [Drosophila rhopaloa]